MIGFLAVKLLPLLDCNALKALALILKKEILFFIFFLLENRLYILKFLYGFFGSIERSIL